MEKRIFVICILVHYITYVTSQRISEVKCFEYSQISRNLTKKFAHIAVWEYKADEASRFETKYASLISDQFLVAAEEIMPRFHVREYKKWLINRVNFSADESLEIIERISHPFFRLPFYNIALLKLKHRVQINSFHRPACLWTKHCHDPASVDIVYRAMTEEFNGHFGGLRELPDVFDIKTTPFKIETDLECYAYQNESLSCLNSLEPYLGFIGGGVIQTYSPFSYLPRNYYIYGMVTEAYQLIGELPVEKKIYPRTKSSLIAAAIDWIEPIVWPCEDVSCGRVHTDTINSLILQSSPTTPGEFPWHAGLYYIEKFGRNYKCGGTLLNEMTIITAAHCITTPTGIMSPDQLLVILGKYDFHLNSVNSRESRVRRIIRHELYSPHRFENNIAILKLQTSMSYSDYIQPICITSKSALFDASNIILPSWGLNKHQENQHVLVKGSFSVLSSSECRKIDTNLSNFLFDTNFCAGYQNGTIACTSDSGGGLVFKVDNRWFLRGVSILGATIPETNQSNPTGVVLFTDAIKNHDWLLNKM